jgi:hypothetical protein
MVQMSVHADHRKDDAHMRTFSRLPRPGFRLGRVGLATLLLVGGLVLSFTLVTSARAANIIVITTCDAAHLDAALFQAQSGDTITFGCDGTIMLDQTLDISITLTIDGSGHTVALDGGHALGDIQVEATSNLTLNALTIQGGENAFGGGGISNEGRLTLTNSTVANNSAPSDGGGIFNGGTLTLTNSTVANNSSTSDEGGGIFNTDTLIVINSTVANNSALEGGGGILSHEESLRTTIIGSIIADNSSGNCTLHGAFADGGFNLESGTDCDFFTANHSLPNTDPKLDPDGLQSNGGPTQTIALQVGSPASDAIPTSSGECPATDQRGVTRPDVGETVCDIGAYESVYDDDLGLSNVPGNQTVNATSPAGAVVTYPAPTATDESEGAPSVTVSCTPTSGSTFAIGITTVTCTATDSDDINSPVSKSFTVTVKGAAAQVSDLLTTVDSFQLGGIQASFDTQLQTVQTDLANANRAQACRDLQAFINHTQAGAGKQLTEAEASRMITAAQRIQAVLGC